MCQATPYYMLRLETGHSQFSVQIWQQTLTCWNNPVNMQNNKIPKLLYNRLHSLRASEVNKDEYNWCSQIKTFLIALNYTTIWEP